MSRVYTYTTNDLTPGDQFMVTGKTTWSRIHKPVEGAALDRENARRRQRNISPINRPYTTINIRDAAVSYVDEANPTKAEVYASEHLYPSNSTKNPGLRYDALNKSSRLPWVGMLQPDGSVQQITLEGELDNDLQVTLVCRVFSAGPGKNNGISLDGVILHEPVRYYSGGMMDTSKLGFTVHPLPAGVPDRTNLDTPAASEAEVSDADSPFSATGVAPVQAPGPGGIRTE